jgi:RimJ/RimL family protein N-acetyltransferase
VRPIPVPELTDGVVTLRAFSQDDVSAVAAALEDGEVSRWTASIPWPYTEAHAIDWIGSHEQRRRVGEGLDLAISDESGAALGAIGLDGLDWSAGRANVGYWVARHARERGLATRAASLLSDWAFDALALRRLQLFTMEGNIASERVAEKAGFRRIETLPDHDLGMKRATVVRWERAAA